MDPSFSKSQKGSLYWTKRREIRKNTEQQMEEVRVLLQKRKSTGNAIFDTGTAICKGADNIAKYLSNETTTANEIDVAKRLMRNIQDAAQILQESSLPCTSAAINPESSPLFNLKSAANNSVQHKNKENFLGSGDENDVSNVFQNLLNKTVATINDEYETFGLNNSSSDENDETDIHDIPDIEDLEEQLAK